MGSGCLAPILIGLSQLSLSPLLSLPLSAISPALSLIPPFASLSLSLAPSTGTHGPPPLSRDVTLALRVRARCRTDRTSTPLAARCILLRAGRRPPIQVRLHGDPAALPGVTVHSLETHACCLNAWWLFGWVRPGSWC